MPEGPNLLLPGNLCPLSYHSPNSYNPRLWFLRSSGSQGDVCPCLQVEGMSRNLKKMKTLQLTPLTERYEEPLAMYSEKRKDSE